jgi:hypothetical protein
MQIFFSFVVVCGCDVFVKALSHTARIDQSVRWFLLHGTINILIAILAIPGIIHILQNPLEAMMVDQTDAIFSASSKYSLALVVSLHIYHCVAFQLSREDRFHHILFLPTLAFTGFYYDWGCMGNWLVFYVCGIPGAIDYFILAFKKMNYLQRLNQKRISANVNIWFRIPGILFAIGISYVIFVESKFKVPIAIFAIQCIFMPFNVLFYGKQATINYTLHQVRHFIPTENWKELKKLQNQC